MDNHAGLIGRVLRLVVAVLLLISVLPFIIGASISFILRTALVVFGLVVFYLSVDYVISRYLRQLNKWIGAIIANLPIILVFILGMAGGPVFGSGEGQLGAIVYVAITLLIAAIRADSGCEVMALPGAIFGHHTHLACLVFSPIDWLESRISFQDGQGQ